MNRWLVTYNHNSIQHHNESERHNISGRSLGRRTHCRPFLFLRCVKIEKLQASVISMFDVRNPDKCIIGCCYSFTIMLFAVLRPPLRSPSTTRPEEGLLVSEPMLPLLLLLLLSLPPTSLPEDRRRRSLQPVRDRNPPVSRTTVGVGFGR